jgi:hypothetical protein
MVITIKTQTIHLDPGLMIYEVEIECKEKVWREVYGSRAEVSTFLRGFEAAYNMVTEGFLRVPMIPTHSDESTDSYTKDPE